MLDMKWVRDHPQEAEAALRSRSAKIDLAPLLALEKERRETITRSEALRAEQNRLGKEIPQRKKTGESADDLIAQLSRIKAEARASEERLKDLEARFQDFALSLPNLPHESVKRSLDKADNVVVRE